MDGSTTVMQATGAKQYLLCRVGTTADQVAMIDSSGGKCENGQVVLNAVTGFADAYNFYIMASNRTVFVFAKSAFDNPGIPVRIYKLRYEDFFICGGGGDCKYSSQVLQGHNPKGP